jgi:ribosome-binding protein aMBF1 (putative translation factor)
MPRKLKSRRCSPRNKKPVRSAQRKKTAKNTKNSNTSINTLEKIPELLKMIGDKDELFENIINLQSLSKEELSEKLKKIDEKIHNNRDPAKFAVLNRQRISILTAYMASNI